MSKEIDMFIKGEWVIMRRKEYEAMAEVLKKKGIFVDGVTRNISNEEAQSIINKEYTEKKTKE